MKKFVLCLTAVLFAAGTAHAEYVRKRIRPNFFIPARELERAELEKMLSRFLRDITKISPDISVGSSIGAYHFLFPHDITELLTETDAALYEAKESGRGCFVIHEDTEAVR